MAKISSARKAAFQILMAVERGQSHSDDLLRAKAVNALSAPDRNLATALVLGVLRWQIQLDCQIQVLLARPNAKLDPEIRIALRIGAFQLLHMDRIPARAAIDESVELAQQAGHHFASGMVNAVLRKMARYKQALDSLSPPAEERGVTHRSGENTSPETPVLKGHGFSRADEATKTNAASQTAEKLNLGSRPCQGTTSQAAEKLDTEGGGGFNPRNQPTKSTGALAPEKSAADLALAQAHPAWMVERWINFYGLDAARSICRHGQSQPVLTLRLASPAVEAELLAAGIGLEPGELLTAARTVVSGDVTATEAFREGRARLQDEGSQLVAELAGYSSESEVLKPVKGTGFSPYITPAETTEALPAAEILTESVSKNRFVSGHDVTDCGKTGSRLTSVSGHDVTDCGKTGSRLTSVSGHDFSRAVNATNEWRALAPAKSILDCCAAPGGKTLILAERNPQARIVACESSASRLEQLRKRLACLGDRVECRQADATALAEVATFDLVLADVPCSGTGTLGRNPEIRHRLRLDGLTRQAERQRSILTAALRAVRPGAFVVYSTCSLEPEENEQVVAAVLAATPQARPVSFEATIDRLLCKKILTPTGAQRLRASLTPEGALRLLPGTFPADGFFICMIERTR